MALFSGRLKTFPKIYWRRRHDWSPRESDTLKPTLSLIGMWNAYWLHWKE